MKLSDHAVDHYSQFGEDGMIERAFELIDAETKICVEFGGGDGFTCSNTAWLRSNGWKGTLIEADETLYKSMLANTWRTSEKVIHAYVTPENINEIIPNQQVDFMSIDVDGDDYAIFQALEVRPRLVCIEYNGSIPPHLSLRQQFNGAFFGASALALVELAKSKNYELVGLTKGNLFFVVDELVGCFTGYDRNLVSLFDYSALSYLVTDYKGRPVVAGALPPWGLTTVPFIRPTLGAPTFPIATTVSAMMEGYESTYGRQGHGKRLGSGWRHNVTQGGSMAMRSLLAVLEDVPTLVLIDISMHGPDATFDWLVHTAETENYRVELVPGYVIALIHIPTERAS